MNAMLSYAAEHRDEALAWALMGGTPYDEAEDLVQNALLSVLRTSPQGISNKRSYWSVCVQRTRQDAARRALAPSKPRCDPFLFQDEIGYPVGGDAERDALARMELRDTLDLIEEIGTPAERAAMVRNLGSDGPYLTTAERASLCRLRKKLRAARDDG